MIAHAVAHQGRSAACIVAGLYLIARLLIRPHRGLHRRRAKLIAMPEERDQNLEAPQLPRVLLGLWPFVTIGALGWLIAVAAAFLIPALQGWRPITLAGIGVSLLGTSIFVLQLAGARRGARGAQTGLESFLDPK